MDATKNFINTLLVVVVLLLVVVLVQQGLLVTPERRIEAAVSFVGDFDMSCYNKLGKTNFGYTAFITPEDYDGDGQTDRFNFDATGSGDPNFYLHTGNFNPRKVFFETNNPSMYETLTSVLFHQLDNLDSKINSQIELLLATDEGGPSVQVIEDQLSLLLDEEATLSKQLNLLPYLAGLEDVSLNCLDLGLEEEFIL